MPLYLGQWKWITDKEGLSYWQMPRVDIGLGNLDLRSLPQCGKPVTTEGYGLFVLSERDDRIGYYLGDSLVSLLASPLKQSLVSALGLGEQLVAETPLDILVELLNHHADPTGQGRKFETYENRNN